MKTTKPPQSCGKYTPEQVRQVRELAEKRLKGPQIEKITGVSVHIVRQIRQHRLYNWVI